MASLPKRTTPTLREILYNSHGTKVSNKVTEFWPKTGDLDSVTPNYFAKLLLNNNLVNEAGVFAHQGKQRRGA